MRRLTLRQLLPRLNPMRYLAIRLFGWFWAVLILAVLCAWLLAKTLSNTPEIRRLHPSIGEQLERQLRPLQRLDSSKAAQVRLPTSRHNQWLILDADSQAVLNPEQLPRGFDQQWLMELSQLRRPRLILQRDIALAGPFFLQYPDRTLAVYQVRKRSGEPGFVLAELPAWVLPALLLLVSAVASIALALTITRPLRSLLQHNLAFAAGDLGRRVQDADQRQDEIGQLAQSFNIMATQISSLLENQQRLLRDVSHELRSPLTRAQLAIGLELRQAKGEQLPRLQHELERIDALLEELLTYSRLDAGQYPQHKEQFDLVHLLDTLIELNRLDADAKHMQITFACQGLTAPWHYEVWLDSRLLSRAFENVLRNAIKYGPTQSTIRVELVLNTQYCDIRIIDAGLGVPEQALGAIFTPFYRVSDSRNQQTGGTGLGLAIAAQAIRQQGGQIEAMLEHAAAVDHTGPIHHESSSAALTTSHGFCVRIRFPLEVITQPTAST
jgi:two-component system sensor histidine kinase CpxA